MPPIRSIAPIASRYPRPGSIGRWCAAPTSSVTPGELVKIELETPHQGRRRFRGILVGVEGAGARVRIDETKDGATAESEFVLPFDDMSDAKLVLTDELIAAALRRGKSEARAARRGRARPNDKDLNQGRPAGSPAAADTEGE